MASILKMIEKMKNQPRGIRYEEAAKVLTHYGYILIRTRGSHRHFRHDSGELITIKEENPLKISYVADILSRIRV
ncbi:MAG: type II toxin-antitoxin system HicA family toxin [Paenibacillaceae bacterium]